MGDERSTDSELEAAQTALFAHLAPEVTTRRVRWSRGETQVLEAGAGDPLLLVHGGLGDAFDWTPIIPTLARNRRVLAVDRPGHGLAEPLDHTQVDLLELGSTFLGDITDALGLRAPDIVANSMGGLWSLAFALEAPDRVGRLVLPGAPAGVKHRVPPLFRMTGLPLVGSTLARLAMSKPSRERNRKFWGKVLVAHPERIDDRLLDASVASGRRNLESHLSLMAAAIDGRGLRPSLVLGSRWQDVHVPTTFLWGERDVFGPPEEADALAAENPNFQVVRIPDAGHSPWIDQPELVTAEIERLLGR